MTHIRFRPGRDLITFQDEVNRMIDGFFRQPTSGDATGTNWTPAVDVRETETDFIVRVELAGVSRSDIKVNLVNNVLTIRGEKKQAIEDKKGNWHHLERLYGTFERALALPASVQADMIKAQYTDGVLVVTVPKAEEAKTREINIEP